MPSGIRTYTTDEITKFYDAASKLYAEEYSAGNSTVSHFFRVRRSIVLKLLSERNGGALLDVGCGPGIYTEPCIALGYQYHGLDASQGMIHECVRRHSQSQDKRFYIGRIENLPFGENHFDTILCLGVIEYVNDLELRNAVYNLRRVLKSNGILIVSLLNKSSPYWWWTIHLYPYLQFLCRNTKHVFTNSHAVPVQHGIRTRYFTVREATDLLRSMHFEVEYIRYFGYDLYLPPFDRWLFRILKRFTSRFEHLHATPGVSCLSKAFIICATRNDGS
jgi:2-polyprenyl-3-methyl-5-hydroxy-6-metoxy-1,4-benzoquinol methylase